MTDWAEENGAVFRHSSFLRMQAFVSDFACFARAKGSSKYPKLPAPSVRDWNQRWSSSSEALEIPFISPNIFAVISPARLGKSQGRRLSGDVPNSHRPVFCKLATNGFWYILVRSQASLHCVHASVPSIFAHQRMCLECLFRGFCRIIGAEQGRIILDRADIHSFGNQRPLQCKSKHERRYVP